MRGAAGSGLGTTIKCLVNQNAGAGKNLAEDHYKGLSTNSSDPPLYCRGFCS
jgi:hypothetical protein